MPLSEDEVSLGDEEFIVPEDPIEQERFKRRLIATAKILKQQQQQLQADQDLLADRWTEVLVAEEYKLERPSKSYPKCRLLPRLGSTKTHIPGLSHGISATSWPRHRGIPAKNSARTPMPFK